MKRVVSIWLPSWPILRLARAEPTAVPLQRPFVLVESGAHGLVITAANAAAAREGVLPGIALADARAAHPGLLPRAAEPEKDAIALLKLTRWAGRYGPNRHVDGNDGLWIDITGVAHLYGGEDCLLDDLTGRLAAFGVPVCAGLADTLGAAHALARFGCPADASWVLAPAEETRSAIADLPVEALRLAAPSVLLLKRLGLKRIGQLYAIPRDSLARRFRSADVAGDVLMRLDQALGIASEPRRPMQPPPILSVTRAFAEPLISSDALEAVAGALCEDLAAALGAKDLGAKAVRLSFFRADGTAGTIAVAMSTPCREGAHMMTLLREKFPTIDAGFGVDLLRLDAVRIGKRLAAQSGFVADRTSVRHSPMALADRLSNRFGKTAVTMLQACDSHIPERAERRVPLLDALAGKRCEPFASPSSHGSRPAFMLARPELIDVVAAVPDGPPAFFNWRRVMRRVARVEGPERIAPEWWRALDVREGGKRPRARDYYKIEDQSGAAYWVFRHGLYNGEPGFDDRPQWFLHGLFA
jgi:protein ImuB